MVVSNLLSLAHFGSSVGPFFNGTEQPVTLSLLYFSLFLMVYPLPVIVNDLQPSPPQALAVGMNPPPKLTSTIALRASIKNRDIQFMTASPRHPQTMLHQSVSVQKGDVSF
jgi:hypothetical protein